MNVMFLATNAESGLLSERVTRLSIALRAAQRLAWQTGGAYGSVRGPGATSSLTAIPSSSGRTAG